MIFSESRFPPRIKSEGKLFGIMLSWFSRRRFRAQRPRPASNRQPPSPGPWASRAGRRDSGVVLLPRSPPPLPRHSPRPAEAPTRRALFAAANDCPPPRRAVQPAHLQTRARVELLFFGRIGDF